MRNPIVKLLCLLALAAAVYLFARFCGPRYYQQALGAPDTTAEANLARRLGSMRSGCITNSYGEIFQFTNGACYYEGVAK